MDINNRQPLTKKGNSVLLRLGWGTFEICITLARKPLESNFDDALYPNQRLRSLIALICLLFVHGAIIYFLLAKKSEQPIRHNDERGQLIFLNTLAQNEENSISQPAKRTPENPLRDQSQKQRTPERIKSPRAPSPSVEKSHSPASFDDAMSRLRAARERRQKLEARAAQDNQLGQTAGDSMSDEDRQMARIQANIKAANYKRKGTNGIFQVLDKGVQTGRFSFRGWTNDPHQSTRQTFEVDAGIGGDVELALVRRMIEIIRGHYSGDFNWDSQRLGRVVVLSARPADTAQLERFMMKEFFD